MAKELKKWSGRGQGSGEYKNGQVFVAAYSAKQAVELINTAFSAWISVYELRSYFHSAWGNTMDHIIPDQPCVYAQKRSWSGEPELIYPLNKSS